MISKKRLFTTLFAFLCLGGVVFGLLQIDLVHQYVEIAWIDATGKEWRLKGKVVTERMWSPSLRQFRNVIVYTPPGYLSPDNVSCRYPVLYLLHGSPDPGYGWLEYGRAPEDVDRLITLEHYPSMLVVMPDGNGQGSLGDSEFVDAPAKQKDGNQGLRVGTYITQDLLHWVDSRYRTVASARGRLIGGVSTGGYAAANLGLQHPDLFGYIFSFSGYYRADPTGWARPVWGYHPTPDELYSQSPEEFISGKSKALKNTIVILGDGFSDRMYYRRDTDRFYNLLKSDHIDVMKLRYPGRHSWDLWRALLRTSLRFVKNRIPDCIARNK